MMQKRLEYFIDLLPKTGSSGFTLNSKKVKREVSQLETEIQFIISDHKSTKKEKKQNIAYCIGLLSHLMDRLHEMAHILPNTEATLPKEILSLLAKFINATELKVPHLFDYKLTTPDYICDELKIKLNKEQKELKRKLHEFGISNDLTDVTLEPFNKFLTKNKKILYRRYFYLIRYQTWLQDFVHSTIHFGEYEFDLIQLLVTKNLNSRNFQRFLVKYIDDKLNQHNSSEAKIKALMQFKICLPQIKPSNELWYTLKNGSTLEVFKEALAVRIKYYEKQLNPSNHNSLQEPQISHTSTPCIKTRLKVPHLAILSRLIKDEDLVVGTGCTELTSSIASIFSQENSEPISIDSLRNNFYSPKEKSLREFKKILESWSERINDYIYDLKYK